MTETRQQKRIRQILNQVEEEKDTSLRGHALKRATEHDVPRTLTAWEWEQWYIDNGKPDAHRPPEPGSSSQPWCLMRLAITQIRPATLSWEPIRMAHPQMKFSL